MDVVDGRNQSSDVASLGLLYMLVVGMVGFRLGGRLVGGVSPAVFGGCRAGTRNRFSFGAMFDAVGVAEEVYGLVH